jgi:integrase
MRGVLSWIRQHVKFINSVWREWHDWRSRRVSWHSFRHSNATLLGEVGESLKTAQAILGHSDVATTLNTYMHVIPDSQRRAVEKVAEVLCPLVPNSGGTTAKVTVN